MGVTKADEIWSFQKKGLRAHVRYLRKWNGWQQRRENKPARKNRFPTRARRVMNGDRRPWKSMKFQINYWFNLELNSNLILQLKWNFKTDQLISNEALSFDGIVIIVCETNNICAWDQNLLVHSNAKNDVCTRFNKTFNFKIISKRETNYWNNYFFQIFIH